MAGEGGLEALGGASQLLVQRAGVADQAVDAIWFSAVIGWPFENWRCPSFARAKSAHTPQWHKRDERPQYVTIEM